MSLVRCTAPNDFPAFLNPPESKISSTLENIFAAAPSVRNVSDFSLYPRICIFDYAKEKDILLL